MVRDSSLTLPYIAHYFQISTVLCEHLFTEQHYLKAESTVCLWSLSRNAGQLAWLTKCDCHNDESNAFNPLRANINDRAS